MENLGKYFIVALVALIAIGALAYARPWDYERNEIKETPEDVLEAMVKVHNYMHGTDYEVEEFEELYEDNENRGIMGMRGSRGYGKGRAMGCH
ncbi:hypothetical protein HY570_00735 [Candidatus Micrarchaeota archaeon]|nr:hypothetical protein [Candidatus Micrarchaeota archaeon]